MRIVTLTEALAAVDFLHKRELLCQKCGWQLATVGNQFSNFCDGCKRPHGIYDELKGPANDFERYLCEALHQWFSQDGRPHPPSHGGDTSDPKGYLGRVSSPVVHYQHMAEELQADGQAPGDTDPV